MTPQQFKALTQLTGLRSPQTTEALRLILIEGTLVGEAAERAGISQSSASHSLARARKVLELAKKATASNPA